eukprot:5011230-Prymnesium_polylepis.1
MVSRSAYRHFFESRGSTSNVFIDEDTLHSDKEIGLWVDDSWEAVARVSREAVSYTHLRAHETLMNL